MSMLDGKSAMDDLATDEALWSQWRNRPLESVLILDEGAAFTWLAERYTPSLGEVEYNSALTALRSLWADVDDESFWDLVDKVEAQLGEWVVS